MVVIDVGSTQLTLYLYYIIITLFHIILIPETYNNNKTKQK